MGTEEKHSPSWWAVSGSALRGEFVTDDSSTRAQGFQLTSGNAARQWRHTAVGRRIKLIGVDKLQRFTQGISHFFRSLNGVGRHINGTDHHFFATDQLNQIHWHARILGFQ